MGFRTNRLDAIAEARGRCANPWCRVNGNNVHHIIHRQEEGTDDPFNLILLCRNCHILYHCGLVGRRTIYEWKRSLSSGDACELGVYLDNWPSLPPTTKAKLRSTFNYGNLEWIVTICSGIFWKTKEPEHVLIYGFPLADAFRQRGRYLECIDVVQRLDEAMDAINTSRSNLFGLSMRVKLEILRARIARGIGDFECALLHFHRAISTAKADQYAGWFEDTMLANVDQTSITTRLCGTGLEDIRQIESIRKEINNALGRHLIHSSIQAAAFLGDLAVAEARYAVQHHDAASVVRIMRPAIEGLRLKGFRRGYCLRLLNFADMLRTMLPLDSKKRSLLIDEIRSSFELAANSATHCGRISLDNSIIGASAEHVRDTLGILADRRFKDLSTESFL